MKLNLELSALEMELTKFEERFQGLAKLPISSKEDFNSAAKEYQELNSSVEKFLGEFIHPKNNIFYSDFRDAGTNQYRLPGLNHSIEVRWKQWVGKIEEKLSTLKQIWNTISHSDLLLGKIPEQELKRRKGLGIREKKAFILEKLYELDGYSSIELLYKMNGITSSSTSEIIEICKSLQSHNLIELLNYVQRDAWVRINIEGREVVEDILSERLRIKRKVEETRNQLGLNEANDLGLSTIKKKLKELVANNEFQKVFEQLDLIVLDEGDFRNELYGIMGRHKIKKDRQRKGIISNSDFFVLENSIRYDLISILDNLRSSDLKDKGMRLAER